MVTGARPEMGRESAALHELVANWHSLTPSVRVAIVDLVRSGVRVGSVIDRGAPRDPPFPIFWGERTIKQSSAFRGQKSRPCARPSLVLELDIDRAFVFVRWIPARPKLIKDLSSRSPGHREAPHRDVPAIMKLLHKPDATADVASQPTGVDETSMAAAAQAKARRPNLDFHEMGLRTARSFKLLPTPTSRSSSHRQRKLSSVRRSPH